MKTHNARSATAHVGTLVVLGLAGACLAATPKVSGSQVIYADYDPNNTLGIGHAGGPRISRNGNAWSGYRSAAGFTTDANTYSLDSVEALLFMHAGDTTDFVESLYSDSGGVPGVSLGRLSGPETITKGNYFFTATGLTLAPDTTYWVVIEPDLSGPSQWSDLWWWVPPTRVAGVGSDAPLSPDNVWEPWYPSGDTASYTLVVYATAIPEPSSLALSSLDAVGLLGLKRHPGRGSGD